MSHLANSKPHDENYVSRNIARIVEGGNNPEEWKVFIDEVKARALHTMDESKRTILMSFLYQRALKALPKDSNSAIHAEILVDYAWIAYGKSAANAEQILAFGRSHFRQFAVIYITEAEIALKQDNYDRATKLLKAGRYYKAQPASLLEEASRRLSKGFHSLLCDVDKDSSSSSGHESSEPELSVECNGSQFKMGGGRKQEHSLTNMPSLKLDTKELQEVTAAYSNLRNHEPTLSDQPKDSSPTSSPGNCNGQQRPLSPKTPKTPVLSYWRRPSSCMVDEAQQGRGQDGPKELKENQSLPNLVTPSDKKGSMAFGRVASSSQKLARHSSLSKLRNVVPPQRVKVTEVSSSSFIEEEDAESSIDYLHTHNKDSSKSTNKQTRNTQDNPLNTNEASDSANPNSVLASQSRADTYSIHKTATHSEEISRKLSSQTGRQLFEEFPLNSERKGAVAKSDTFNIGSQSNENERVSSQIPHVKSQADVDMEEVRRDRPVQGPPMSAQGQIDQENPVSAPRDDRQQIGASAVPTNVLLAPPAAVMNPTPQTAQKFLYVNGKAYTVLRQIGQGGSAKVYQVQDQATFEIKALKRVNLSGANPQILESFKNEIALLKKLQACDCVVRLYDSEYDHFKKKLLVVMQFGETDLARFIAENGSIKNQDALYPVTICYLWGNMVKAVRAMHKEGVVHSDLKPANFILVSGKIKLIDFGIANSIQQDKTSMLKDHTVGTPSFMSPEALMANSCSDSDGKKALYKIGFKSDVWSLGCILYQMVYGQTPFQGCKFKTEAIVNPKHIINFPDNKDAYLTDILKKCLTRDVKLRPSTEDLMNHPYLTKKKAETPVNESNLMSHFATASPRSQQAFLQLLQRQQGRDGVNSSKTPT